VGVVFVTAWIYFNCREARGSSAPTKKKKKRKKKKKEEENTVSNMQRIAYYAS
jgi:hypothetical protein